jgi:hypothetical protein
MEYYDKIRNLPLQQSYRKLSNYQLNRFCFIKEPVQAFQT